MAKIVKPVFEDGVLKGDLLENANNTIVVRGDGKKAENQVVNVVGGAKVDKVTVEKGAKNYSIDTGAGNDNITVQAGASVEGISADAGNNTITVNGSAGAIVTGDYADKITVNGSVGSISAGDGKNTVTINGIVEEGIVTGELADKITVNANGQVGYIESVDGKNTITVNGKAGYIETGSGDDKITVGKSARVGAINAGEGANTITVNGVVESITTGEGVFVDKITVNNADAIAKIETGAGNDTITVSAGQDVYIDAGAGNDKITVDWAKTTGDVTIVADDESVYSDTITIKGLKSTNFKSVILDGDNLVITEKNTDRTLTIENWSQETVQAITFGDGKKTRLYLDTSAKLESGLSEATTGKDTIKVDGSNLTIGKDKFIVPIDNFDAENPFTIDAKSGDDTITISSGKIIRLIWVLVTIRLLLTGQKLKILL